MIKIGTKVKSLANVTLSNVVIFLGNIIVHFILPLTLPVEDYAYWQLHTLYVGYCAFVLLGLNDGIHLLYSNLNYSKENYPLFIHFRNVACILSLIASVIVCIIAVAFRDGIEQFILLVIAFETPAAALNSIFHYINQGTMRFKQYARGNRIEGISLVVIISILCILKVNVLEFYIIGAALSKYIRLLYYVFSGKEIALGFAWDPKNFIPIAINTCKQGIILMISVTLNSSFLLSTKLIIKNYLSVTDYGAFSFAINILSAANVLVISISQVFYPILNRTSKDRYSELTKSLGMLVSYIGLLAMAGYFVATILINHVYTQYLSIIEYLHILFPIFVYTCKINLVVINTFKVKKLQMTMLGLNCFAVVLNLLLSIIAINVLNSIFAAAIASLATYIIYYFVSQYWIKRRVDSNAKIQFYDLFYIGIFEAIVYVTSFISTNIDRKSIMGLFMYFFAILIFLFLERKNLKEFYNILTDK